MDSSVLHCNMVNGIAGASLQHGYWTRGCFIASWLMDSSVLHCNMVNGLVGASLQHG